MMLKKRLIFILLYNDGQFMLSRNFRLQKVGDIKWLQKNYDFAKVSFSIDELVVLDVTRGQRDLKRFCNTLKKISAECFLPIAAGGGISEIRTARDLLLAGADKVVLNSALAESPSFVYNLAQEFGQQCIVASVDIKLGSDGEFLVFTRNATKIINPNASYYLKHIAEQPIGELYLNSIDRDGTGQGLDLQLLDLLPANFIQPVILAGGIGNSSHMSSGFLDNRIDAVATANLLNFIGDGLSNARYELIKEGFSLATWDLKVLPTLKCEQ